MAEFGANVTSLSAPRGAGTDVLKPVTANPGAAIIEALGVGVDIFNKVRASDQAKEEGKIRSSYTRELRGIESAFRSGTISAQEANTRREKLKSDYTGTYPDFIEDFDEITTKFSRGTSLQRAEQAQEDQRQVRLASIQAASKDGVLFPPNASPETEDQLVEIHKKQMRARQDIQEYRDSARFDWEAGRVSREEAERKAKENANRQLNVLGATNIEMFDVQIKDLVEKTKAGLPYDQALLALTRYHTNLQAQVNAVAGNNQELAKHYGGFYDNMFNTAKLLLDPKTRSETVQSQLNEFRSKAELAVLTTNPRILELHLSNRLLGSMVNTMLPMQTADREIKVGLMEFKVGNYPPSVLGAPGSKAVTDGVKKDLGDAAAAPKERQEEAKQLNANSLNGLLTDLGNKYRLGVPLTEGQVQDVVKIVNDIHFPEYVASGKINPEQLGVAQQALRFYYNDKVMTKAREAVVREREIGGNKFKLTDYVDFNFSGNAVTVTPKRAPMLVAKGFGSALSQVALDMQRPKIEQEARTAARAISSVIVQGAHLEGHTDYKRVWEENKSKMFPELFPEETKTPSKAPAKADYSKESNLKGIVEGTDSGAGMTAGVLQSLMKDFDKLTPEQRLDLRNSLDKINN